MTTIIPDTTNATKITCSSITYAYNAKKVIYIYIKILDVQVQIRRERKRQRRPQYNNKKYNITTRKI